MKIKRINKNTIISILFISIVFVVYLTTSSGNTPYDYFIRLSEAFIKGKYYIDSQPSWLNELIPMQKGGYAIVYPPAPAIVLIPFLLIFKNNFPQQILAHIMGAFIALIWWKISLLKTKNYKKAFWIFAIVAFGNIIWFLSSNGSAWYLGQVSGVFFLTASIFESIHKKRPFWVSLFWGMAVLSRLQIFFTLPLVIYLNKKVFGNKKGLFLLITPASLLGIFYLFYNHIRFGSFLETGYSLIPGVLDEPWYEKGIFSPNYIKRNLEAMFLSMPILKKTYPYIIPSWGGLAIWITSPVFVFVLFIKKINNEIKAVLFSISTIALITLSHGGTGFTQFGYRYAVDFYPLIFFILVEVIKNSKIQKIHWFLLFLSILVNLWGVLWINKFGWVEF